MIDLELLTDGTATARNFDKLRTLLIDTGGQSIGLRFGSDSLSFAASAVSVTRTVNHGLAKIPQAILVLPTLGTEYIVANYVGASRNDVSFQVSGQTNSGSAITADLGFFWVAIG